MSTLTTVQASLCPMLPRILVVRRCASRSCAMAANATLWLRMLCYGCGLVAIAAEGPQLRAAGLSGLSVHAVTFSCSIDVRPLRCPCGYGTAGTCWWCHAAPDERSSPMCGRQSVGGRVWALRAPQHSMRMACARKEADLAVLSHWRSRAVLLDHSAGLVPGPLIL